MGEAGQDRGADEGGSSFGGSAGGLAEGDGVGGVVAGGGLEGHVGQDVGAQGTVVDLVGGAQAGGEVALGEAVVGRVEGHPAGELAEFGQGTDEADGGLFGMSAVVEQEADRAELRADVGKMAGSAVFVVEELEQREVLFDLGDQRIAGHSVRQARRVGAASGLAVEVVGDEGEQAGSRDGQEAATIDESA